VGHRGGGCGNSGEIPDQRLALMFACAHPAIDAGIRAPLILQVILGPDAKAIASAFLTSPTAMGKRLVRAKEKIRQARIPFTIPQRITADRATAEAATIDPTLSSACLLIVGFDCLPETRELTACR